jgi:hypothetical protein
VNAQHFPISAEQEGFTVPIQSIRRSRVTRGPKSTKSGEVTGHRSQRRNPQIGQKNAKVCLLKNLNEKSIFSCLPPLILIAASISNIYIFTEK